MKKIIITIATIAVALNTYAFCGFYVAKADKKLFNNTSEVILVRDGNKTAITMSNDFKGDVKDFAMVVPVPVVLQKSDIKIAEQRVFDMLDAYSAPRLVEYYDENPCNRNKYDKMMFAKSTAVTEALMDGAIEKKEKDYGVTIQAKYTVGEYDILILDATQSNGLKDWLTDNGYKIPKDAEEVLDPYIKSNMKFFVAKVNIQEQQQGQYQSLRPLQITFNSPKFMLPIRLGMANSNGPQDLIIYSFTKSGHTECTNYRTVNMPTDFNIPERIQPEFASFYKSVFDKKWNLEQKNVILKEYAWDISGRNFMHCDPCISTAPDAKDLLQAGVWWINENNSYGSYSSNYQEDVFITRLHLRYDRTHFAQDLNFQITPNNTNFQCRYVINHKANGNMDCDEAHAYKERLYMRNNEELRNLYRYAGWNIIKGKINKKEIVSISEEGSKMQQYALFPDSVPTKEVAGIAIIILGLLMVNRKLNA